MITRQDIIDMANEVYLSKDNHTKVYEQDSEAVDFLTQFTDRVTGEMNRQMAIIKDERDSLRSIHEALIREIGRICGEDLSDEPRAKWALLEVSNLRGLTDSILAYYQEWKEDHMSHNHFIDMVERCRQHIQPRGDGL